MLNQISKRYSGADIDWLEQRAHEIRQHYRFEDFQETCPAAASVLTEGGRTYGVSIDAAVTEFDKFIALT